MNFFHVATHSSKRKEHKNQISHQRLNRNPSTRPSILYGEIIVFHPCVWFLIDRFCKKRPHIFEKSQSPYFLSLHNYGLDFLHQSLNLKISIQKQRLERKIKTLNVETKSWGIGKSKKCENFSRISIYTLTFCSDYSLDLLFFFAAQPCPDTPRIKLLC